VRNFGLLVDFLLMLSAFFLLVSYRPLAISPALSQGFRLVFVWEWRQKAYKTFADCAALALDAAEAMA
jgi:hypothetical protein